MVNDRVSFDDYSDRLKYRESPDNIIRIDYDPRTEGMRVRFRDGHEKYVPVNNRKRE